MNIDITPYIKELLFEHNNLVIPSFGAFTLQYAPSTIDHVQGLLSPPTKSISFDSNLIVNDGKLVDIIQQKHKVSTAEANQQIDTFVQVIKDQLGRREMVNIAGVGRLYKDFESNIQFIPDSTNFNKESFGLPSIQFYPILKEKITVDSIVPVGKKTSYTSKKDIPLWERIQIFIEDNNWVAPAAVAALLIIIGFFIFPQIYSGISDKEKVVNQSPTETLATQETMVSVDVPEDEDKTDFLADQAISETDSEDIIDTESITPNPNQRIALVSVGVFANKKNAQKRIEQVYDYGFDVLPEKYYKNGRELTKVGIQFDYETEEEFENTFQEIKKRFSNAVVIEKE